MSAAWFDTDAAGRVAAAAGGVDLDVYRRSAALSEDAIASFANVDWSRNERHRVEAGVHVGLIGRYRLAATRGVLGDSVEVQLADDAAFSLAQNDTVVRDVRVGYPRTTAAGLRTLTAGRRVVVEGLALNNWTAFGDSTACQ